MPYFGAGLRPSTPKKGYLAAVCMGAPYHIHREESHAHRTTYLSCPTEPGSRHGWPGRSLPCRSREDAPKGQQVADEVDAEVDVAGDGQVVQVAEVRVHAAAAHGNGCALLGTELQAAQRWGDRLVCNDPRHLHHEVKFRIMLNKTSWALHGYGCVPFSAPSCRLRSVGETVLYAVTHAICSHAERGVRTVRCQAKAMLYSPWVLTCPSQRCAAGCMILVTPTCPRYMHMQKVMEVLRTDKEKLSPNERPSTVPLPRRLMGRLAVLMTPRLGSTKTTLCIDKCGARSKWMLIIQAVPWLCAAGTPARRSHRAGG